jgi:TonB family protein
MRGISARRLAGCAGCVLVSMLPAVSPAAPRWQRATSSHFVLYSSAERDSVLQTALELEGMAEILRMWGLGSRATMRDRVVLLAFPDKDSFRPHQPVVGGKRTQVAGYVRHLGYGSWIGYDESDERGRSVAHHEYTHTLVDEEFRLAPLCINEGLAEYLSTFTARSDAVLFGHDLPWHTFVVQAWPLFDMDELFGVGFDSPAYRGGDEQARFYAESWALVRYLIHAGGGYANLRRFVRAVAEGTPSRAAFDAAYPQESWKALPDRLRRFASEHETDSRQIGFGSPLDRVRVDIREVSAGEVGAQTCLWRGRNPSLDSTETNRMLDRAASGAPELTHAVRGVLKVFPPAGWDEAMAELRAAAAPGTHDALTLSVAGLAMMSVGLQADSTRREALLREAGDILDRSLAADSSDARAMAGFVECRIRTRDVTPRVTDRLRRIAPILPDDPDIQLWAALMDGMNAAAPAPRAPGDSLPKLDEHVYVEDLPETITKVWPHYPEGARAKGIRGTVLVQALVGRDGSVLDVRVKNSVPELDDAAVQSVKQWRFKPAQASQKPVPVWVAIPLMFSF